MDYKLTVEELKSLPVGDWVWIVYLSTSRGTYGKITEYYGHCYIETDGSKSSLSSSNYGVRWIAYKNKELAEANPLNFPLELEVQALRNTCYFKEAYINQLKEDLERVQKELVNYRRKDNEN